MRSLLFSLPLDMPWAAAFAAPVDSSWSLLCLEFLDFIDPPSQSDPFPVMGLRFTTRVQHSE